MLEDEAMKSFIDDKQAEKTFGQEDIGVKPEAVDDIGQGINIDFSFLTAKTGDGSVERYLDHPLNYKKSRGIAQVIRGFTGMFGSLDLAVIDIALGGFEVIKEGRVK